VCVVERLLRSRHVHRFITTSTIPPPGLIYTSVSVVITRVSRLASMAITSKPTRI